MLATASLDTLLTLLVKHAVIVGKTQALSTNKYLSGGQRLKHVLHSKAQQHNVDAVLAEVASRIKLKAGAIAVTHRLELERAWARRRRKLKCAKCGSTGGRQGYYLDLYYGPVPSTGAYLSLRGHVLWTANPQNLPSVEKFTKMLDTWVCCCVQCAKYAGWPVFRRGQVGVKEEVVDVQLVGGDADGQGAQHDGPVSTDSSGYAVELNPGLDGRLGFGEVASAEDGSGAGSTGKDVVSSEVRTHDQEED